MRALDFLILTYLQPGMMPVLAFRQPARATSGRSCARLLPSTPFQSFRQPAKRTMETFVPYIAKDRRFEELRFDFLIADLVGQSWYDGSPKQFMPERGWCRDHILPGMVVVDCGAHHGMMTVLFALWTGLTGKVLAYEAIPANREVIEKNVRLNGLGNVIIRSFGVSDRNGKVCLLTNTSNSSPGGTEMFDVVTLDADLADQRVDFLKFDVEGSELDALTGAHYWSRAIRVGRANVSSTGA